MAVLSTDTLLLHWPGAAGGHLVGAGAAGVLLHCLCGQRNYINIRNHQQQCRKAALHLCIINEAEIEGFSLYKHTVTKTLLSSTLLTSFLASISKSLSLPGSPSSISSLLQENKGIQLNTLVVNLVPHQPESNRSDSFKSHL